MSTAVVEKTAPFILDALERGLPWSIGDPTVLQACASLLDAACDRIVIDQHSDNAASNLPGLRHIMQTMSDATPKVLRATSACELHVIHNLRSTAPGMRQNVGKIFSLRDICRLASFHIVQATTHSCHSSVRRLEGPPPVDANKSDVTLLVGALSDVEAPHHQKTARPSTFASVLAEL